ncbi:MAG: hypothetical protein U9Q17_01510 [Chloroflexota bacterium]|nr:hypothetical protein [Chloroflexota bacterium]
MSDPAEQVFIAHEEEGEQKTKKAARKTEPEEVAETLGGAFDATQQRAAAAYMAYLEAQRQLEEAYKDQELQAEKTYNTTIEQVRKACDESIAQATRARNESIAQANKACEESMAQVLKTRNEAEKKAREAHNETIDRTWAIFTKARK